MNPPETNPNLFFSSKSQFLEVEVVGQATYLHGGQSLIQKRIVVTIEIAIYLQILN